MRLANVSPASFETNTHINTLDAAAFNRRLFQLSRKLLCDADRRLTPAARHIGALLLDKANASTGYSWPSYNWFTRRFGYSATTIAKAIRVLARLNYLRVERRQHRSSRYHPNLALGDVAPHQTAPKPMPSRSQCQTPESEVSATPESGDKPPNRDKPYCLTPDSSCDTAPDEASASAVEPPKVLGKESKIPDGGEPPELSRPNPAQQEMLLPIRGGLALTPVEAQRRADRICQKAFASQSRDTMELLMACWERLEPAVLTGIRAGWTDRAILQDVIWLTLRRSSATISASA